MPTLKMNQSTSAPLEGARSEGDNPVNSIDGNFGELMTPILARLREEGVSRWLPQDSANISAHGVMQARVDYFSNPNADPRLHGEFKVLQELADVRQRLAKHGVKEAHQKLVRATRVMGYMKNQPKFQSLVHDLESARAIQEDGGAPAGKDSDGKRNEKGGTSKESKKEEEKESSEARKEEEEAEELWDLKMVLPVDQILASANMCDTPGCNLVACCFWSSSLDPETPWYTCLDCQENDFGGWPENKEELPIEMWKGGIKEAILDKCTALVDPPMPDLPYFEEEVKEEDSLSDKGDVHNGEENDSSSDALGEETWELKKVFGVEDLKKKKPVMCSYSDRGECDLVACCEWVCVSGHDPNPWYCCLDHQKSDYGGWPEEETEFPVQFLTKENRELILEKCANEEDQMPNLPKINPLKIIGGVGKSAVAPGQNQSSIDACFEAETDDEEMSGIAKRATGGGEETAQRKSKKPRLQLGGLFDKAFGDAKGAVERKKEEYREEVKREKERLFREWWVARAETAPYKKMAARQEKMKTDIACLELDEGEISKLLDASQNCKGARARGVRKGLVKQKGEIEKELKFVRKKLERSKEELRELDEEVSRELRARTKAIEKQSLHFAL